MGLGLGCTIRTRYYLVGFAVSCLLPDLAIDSCSHVVFAMHVLKLDMAMFQVSVCKQ